MKCIITECLYFTKYLFAKYFTAGYSTIKKMTNNLSAVPVRIKLPTVINNTMYCTTGAKPL